ncbi:Uncharacterised protein [Mycobacteroides abscessus subsp. abscessus]|nr:Uncharacterised protein [Mycobacteroides abscessus subsp. abscessus]
MLDVSVSGEVYGVSADALHLVRLILDTPKMRELSVVEQTYLALIDKGYVAQVAPKWKKRPEC